MEIFVWKKRYDDVIGGEGVGLWWRVMTKGGGGSKWPFLWWRNMWTLPNTSQHLLMARRSTCHFRSPVEGFVKNLLWLLWALGMKNFKLNQTVLFCSYIESYSLNTNLWIDSLKINLWHSYFLLHDLKLVKENNACLSQQFSYIFFWSGRKRVKEKDLWNKHCLNCNIIKVQPC